MLFDVGTLVPCSLPRLRTRQVHNRMTRIHTFFGYGLLPFVFPWSRNDWIMAPIAWKVSRTGFPRNGFGLSLWQDRESEALLFSRE